MKDLNKVKSYIGIDIEYGYDHCGNTLTLSQENYIETLAKLYNIENSKLFNTPMEPNLKLIKSNEDEEI